MRIGFINERDKLMNNGKEDKEEALLIDKYVWALSIGKNHAFKKTLKKEIQETWKGLNLEQRIEFVEMMRERVKKTEKFIKEFRENHIREISIEEFASKPREYVKFACDHPNQVVVKDDKGKTVLFLQMPKKKYDSEDERKADVEMMEKLVDQLEME